MLLRLTIQAWIHLDTFFSAIKRNWKRLLVGAFLGWIITTLTGALLDYFVWYSGFDLSLMVRNIIAVIYVYSGIIFGALIAYAIRPQNQIQ